MSSSNGRGAAKLQDEIARQFGGDDVRRYMAVQPVYRVVEALPDYMRDLLDRLENAELMARADGATKRN